MITISFMLRPTINMAHLDYMRSFRMLILFYFQFNFNLSLMLRINHSLPFQNLHKSWVELEKLERTNIASSTVTSSQERTNIFFCSSHPWLISWHFMTTAVGKKNECRNELAWFSTLANPCITCIRTIHASFAFASLKLDEGEWRADEDSKPSEAVTWRRGLQWMQ